MPHGGPWRFLEPPGSWGGGLFLDSPLTFRGGASGSLSGMPRAPTLRSCFPPETKQLKLSGSNQQSLYMLSDYVGQKLEAAVLFGLCFLISGTLSQRQKKLSRRAGDQTHPYILHLGWDDWKAVLSGIVSRSNPPWGLGSWLLFLMQVENQHPKSIRQKHVASLTFLGVLLLNVTRTCILCVMHPEKACTLNTCS